jgi:hypothetical protein
LSVFKRNYRYRWAFTLAVLTVYSGTALAQTDQVRRLNINMPSGRCSLNVFEDGSASLNFGSMPRWANVTKNTFDFNQLVDALSARSFPISDPKPVGVGEQVKGTITLPGKDGLMYFYDLEFARSLFTQAWQARVSPKTNLEREDQAWVAKACSLNT